MSTKELELAYQKGEYTQMEGEIHYALYKGEIDEATHRESLKKLQQDYSRIVDQIQRDNLLH